MTTAPASLDAHRARRAHRRLTAARQTRNEQAHQLYRVLTVGDDQDLYALAFGWSGLGLAEALTDCIVDGSLVVLVVDTDGETRRWPAREAA